MLTNTNITINAPQAPKHVYNMNVSIGDMGLFWSIVSGIVIIIGLIFTVLKIRKMLDVHIKESLSRKEIIESVSLLVKPDMIFDERESVLADRGAAALIKTGGIHVAFGVADLAGGPKLPVEIRIEFSKHQRVPPLLTPLNADVVDITTKTGKSFDWIYVLKYSIGHCYDGGYARKYRLEIF